MARVLAKSNIQKARSRSTDAREAILPPIENGLQKLYNHSLPALLEGVYGIEAKQTIQTANEELHIYNFDSATPTPALPGQDYPVALQKVTVQAPRFQLDPKVINSYYPPDGFTEQARILPHIVFNDPHVPWERPLFQPAFHPSVSAIDPFQRLSTRPPWIALLVFDPEELELAKPDGEVLQIPSFNANALPNSGAYSMTVGDYMTKIASRIALEGGLPPGSAELPLLQGSAEPVNIIFPKKELIQAVLPQDNLIETLYLSHVRQISTAGLPDAANEESRLYSICISQRTGPMVGPKSGKPTTQIVHLVSVENLIYGPYDPSNVSDRIGMISLFSWNYTSTPPLATDFVTMMKTLADQKQMLKPPNPILQEISLFAGGQALPNMKTAADMLQRRLSMGYTITRWRTSKGEETVALTRGPLVPIATPVTPAAASSSDWPKASVTGEDYQILDRDLGLIDVSYSSAWQLGKMMAIIDSVFFGALLRFRSAVYKSAASGLRMELMRLRPASTVINDAPHTLQRVDSLTTGIGLPVRNAITLQNDFVTRQESPASVGFAVHTDDAVDRLTRSGERTYSDYQLEKGDNSDWEIIHNWISDKLFLSGIPFHYLVIDPSHIASTPIPFSAKDPIQLPSEALRFFHVDDAWLDCFIDGALSTANHVSVEEDHSRLKIKELYNVFLRTQIAQTQLKPPVPRYGFFLRSLLVKAVPELRITVTCWKIDQGAVVEDNIRMPMVRLIKIDEHTLLALLDCLPQEIAKITLAQPPHQQRFTAPVPAAPGVPYQLKRLYSRGAPAEWPSFPAAQAVPEPEVAGWYDARTRSVRVDKLAQSLRAALPFTTPFAAFDAKIGSAIVGLELNDRNYQLEIKPPAESIPLSMPARDRQLWTGGALTEPLQHVEPTRGGTSPWEQVPRSLKVSLEVAVAMKPPTAIPTTEHLDTAAILLSQQTVTGTGQGGTAIIYKRPVALPQTRLTLQSTLLRAPPSAQYNLRVRPAYRNDTPRPVTSGIPPKVIFSAHDYIPTTSPYLIDLIFCINQISAPASVSTASLCALSIIVPSHTVNGSVSEPLIDGNYNGSGAQMLHNKRLTPFVVRTREQLQIRLMARSSRPGELKNLPEEMVRDASFVLRGCAVAPIQSESRIEVVGEGSVSRGVTNISVEETYRLGDEVAETVSLKRSFQVLKKAVEE
ncbi:MAG: hypothetical protein Q9209_004486 [Squamulea sp. 1 TL-2023]